MALGDNEKSIVTFKFIFTSLILRIILKIFKGASNYTDFLSACIIVILPNLKCFQRDPKTKPSLLKMKLLLILTFIHLSLPIYLIYNDSMEVKRTKNITKELALDFIILLLNNEHFKHISIHIIEIFKDLSKFIHIWKQINKEKEYVKNSEMHKLLTIKPFKKDLDGAGGDFNDDTYEEVMVTNSGEKSKLFSTRKIHF
ncbi:hypothetical protein ACTA71_001229 [Dictyostelium dimigraforme]